MKIIQKTIWMNYLTIGISLFFLISAMQCNERVEPDQTADFIYINESGDKINMTVYSKLYSQIYPFILEDGDSIQFVVTNSPGALPFDSPNKDDPKGDSVVFEFMDNKCTSYTKEGQNGVFRLAEYEDFTFEILEEDKFTLYYIIDIDDYNRAINCN